MGVGLAADCIVCYQESGVSVFKKIARVLQEKAQQDIDRITKGTSKTREKLGVSCLSLLCISDSNVLYDCICCLTSCIWLWY